ncbi:MAG: hypothetical protein P0S96_00375 [Simkaniaceae bacterium]|nr:hypothetical protein [Candidatus Sacchlamyda saccharinae]
MNKLKVLQYYLQAKRRMRFSRPKLDRFQSYHREKIAQFAKTKSLFYRKGLGGIISKKEMMENFSSFNTKSIDREAAFALAFDAEKKRDFTAQLDGVTVGLSSGTSGNRGLFLVSEEERLSWCGHVLARVLPKAPWRRQKIAFFLRANSPLYETVKSSKLEFAYFDLLENPDSLYERVKAYQPDVLVAPPSMLRMLIGSCSPERVVSVAETLFSTDRKQLEEGFGQQIFQVYQCTEGFLGFTCSHGTLHLNEDLISVEKEYLSERSFVPIITDLFRKTQPIIRYRLDDVLVEKEGPCPCGCVFQPIERIEGRCDDILHVQMAGGKTKPVFPDFVCRKIVAASEEITDYAVVQKALDEWEIYLKPMQNQPVSKQFHELFEQLGCVPPKLSFTNQMPPRDPGAKLRRIMNEGIKC